MEKGKGGKPSIIDIMDLAEEIQSVAQKLTVVATGMGEHLCEQDNDFYEGLEGILNDQVQDLRHLANEGFEIARRKRESTGRKVA